MIRSLPPVETMETLLFQLITVGFVLLSITLLSGIGFSNQLFGKAFVFNHHSVLSLLAWCSFATLLGGSVRRLAWSVRRAMDTGQFYPATTGLFWDSVYP